MKPMKKLISLFLILSLLLCGCSVEIVLAPPETAPAASDAADTELLVHFIDVGQADCALIEWGDRFVLIDGGNRDDSQLVVSYLQQQNVQQLEAVICSHAHEDHVGGLPAVLAVFPTARVYAPTNTYSSKVFDDFLYYTDQQRLSVTIPKPGDQLTLRNGKETLVLTILGPTKTYAETNNTSLVVRLDYGETAFLFTGDMEVLAENDMLDYWAENRDWAATVLKAGHHGSSTSSSSPNKETCLYLNVLGRKWLSRRAHSRSASGSGKSIHTCIVMLFRASIRSIQRSTCSGISSSGSLSINRASNALSLSAARSRCRVSG